MYIFIVSSAIETDRGIFSHQERLEQTLETFESIKRLVPDSQVITFESGSTLSEENKNILSSHSNLICLQNEDIIVELSKRRMNSHAETIATRMVLLKLHQYITPETKRIFKISGRYKLQDTFDIYKYKDIDDKFVFAKRKNTWLSEDQQKQLGIDGVFDTRLYSFTPNLINYYSARLLNIYDDLRMGIDLEHSIYKNIHKELIVEFDKVHCEGKIAPDGSIKID